MISVSRELTIDLWSNLGSFYKKSLDVFVIRPQTTKVKVWGLLQQVVTQQRAPNHWKTADEIEIMRCWCCCCTDHYAGLEKVIRLLRRAGKLEECPKFFELAEKSSSSRPSLDAGYNYCKGLYEWSVVLLSWLFVIIIIIIIIIIMGIYSAPLYS